MQVVLIILSVALLGVIINYAVSSKSSKILKLAALIALGLIALSLGVASIILVVNGSSHEAEETRLPVFLGAPAEAPKKSNAVEIIIFLVFLAVIVGFIAVTTSKDRKRRMQEAKKTGASHIFNDADKHEDLGEKADAPPDKAKDDFDLDLG
jgi:multisubunit Na+/H+ antiporter MnhB subunit